MFGCYETLDGGDLGEALEDFTGGVSEQINMADIGVVDNPEEMNNFFDRLKKEVERKSLLAASIPVGYLAKFLRLLDNFIKLFIVFCFVFHGFYIIVNCLCSYLWWYMQYLIVSSIGNVNSDLKHVIT